MNNPWEEVGIPSKDFLVRRVDIDHSLDFFWARDLEGNYLFIYEFPLCKEKINLPDITGIKSALFVTDKHTRIVLKLNDENDWEIFLTLCNDLIYATKNIEKTLNAHRSIVKRLQRWQSFMKQYKHIYLSERQIKGLIGELVFIRDFLIPQFGANSAIQFWQGPEAPQDFNVSECAFEVKCQSGSSSSQVTISSLDQLSTQLPEMYLVVITLGQASSDDSTSVNIPKLVNEIQDKVELDGGNQLKRFIDFLHASGYVKPSYYRDYNYLVTKVEMFYVDENFPKIVPGTVPKGVTNVSYKINLIDCQPFSKEPDWVREMK